MDVHYSKVSDKSIELDNLSISDAKRSRKFEHKGRIKAWINTTFPLVVHCILSVGIIVFVIGYVDGHPFNITDHIAFVQTARGDLKLPLPFSLTQSDIVTILSALIVVQKLVLMAWAAPLCWRIAIFLMDKHGLHRRDLTVLVKYRLLKPRTYLKSFPSFLIGTLLVASLAASIASPMLTGSIAWNPQNIPIHNLATSPIHFEPLYGTEPDNYLGGTLIGDWDVYTNPKADAFRVQVTQDALGLVGDAWQRDADKGAFKRVSHSVEALAMNSTIENLTLPYFVTHSIQWIQDENDIPAYVRGINPRKAMYDSLALSPSPNPYVWMYHGTALLIPDLTSGSNWTNVTLGPRAIEEKRLLIYWVGHSGSNITQGLPPGTYIYTENLAQVQFALAWVTFSAGVGICKEYHCVVSNRFTIQNSSAIELEPHPFTLHALYLAMPISSLIVKQNTSIPYSWDNPNGFIEALLQRSYTAAWNIMVDDFLVQRSSYNYRPALPSLVAHVSQSRIFAWLGIQLSVTLLSILFLVILSRSSEFPLLGDTTLTAFYLDTTYLPESDSPHLFVKGALRVREEDNRLTVKVE